VHDSVYDWTGTMVAGFGLDAEERRTLEMGSADVNGSVRKLFGSQYVGIDVEDGPGVDIVASAHEVPFPDDSFDTVVSTEMLEHDPNPRQSIVEAARVLKPGGFFLVTARGNGYPHHYPPDYWRFTPEGMALLLKEAGFEAWQTFEDDPQTPGVFAIALMPGGSIDELAFEGYEEEEPVVEEQKTFLNIGGANKSISLPPIYEGWNHVLLDIAPNHDVDIIMDARELKDVEDLANSFDGVFTSHNLEHYYRHEVKDVLEGAFHVLKPGCDLLIFVPSLDVAAKALASGEDLWDTAYVADDGVGPIAWGDMIYGYGPEIEKKGDHWGHKTGFTAKSLGISLLEAGFTNLELQTHGHDLVAVGKKP
jgi:predicted SAM-dependent methyltransferase